MPDDILLFGMAAEKVLRPENYCNGYIEVSRDELCAIVAEMDNILSSWFFRRGDKSAFLRSMCLYLSERHARLHKGGKLDESLPFSWFISNQRELVADLNGWIRHSLAADARVRITGL
ncbi:MAG: hypothetical protein J6W80_04250 [Kiritimatiellae bacterium]|nr:hypothetical protein [Kiritimatiellia bacterium]